ncbi:MAG: hypothetical protein EBV59_09530 [Synechococcaceae bacterium WB7_1C_051]|nr:hypothetical protein [Synechococcaceae bacterium WB7_1C_051]
MLVARSVLDPALKAELLANPEVCCKANGVSIQDGLRLVLTHPDQHLFAKYPAHWLRARLRKQVLLLS